MKVYKNVALTIGTLIFLGFLISNANAIENTQQKELKLWEINASNLSDIPKGIFQCQLTPRQPNNGTLSFNQTKKSIDFNWVYPVGYGGEIWIGSLYPSTDQNLSFVMDIDRDNWNGSWNIQTSNAFLTLTKTDYGAWIITSYYMNARGVETYSAIRCYYRKYGDPLNCPLNFSLVSYDLNRTNEVKFFNDTGICTCNAFTPYYAKDSHMLPYPAINIPLIEMWPSMSIAKTVTGHIYSITQTIPRKIITPYSVSKESFGLDGPHPLNTIQKGCSLLVSNNQTATIWADVGFLDTARINFIKYLLAHGWELGIHFHDHLYDKNQTAAKKEIDTEMRSIARIFNTTPKSFCSLQNHDNVTYATYIYKKYGALWRNGRNAAGWCGNYGALGGYSWEFINKSTVNRVTYPMMSHQIDVFPPLGYDHSDPAELAMYSNGYKASGVQICSFYEFYKSCLAQNETSIYITESDTNHMKFILKTNGYPVNVNVKTSISTPNVYSNNAPVTFALTTDGVKFLADSGIYTVTSDVLPTAGSTRNVNPGSHSTIVKFTDLSTGSPTSYNSSQNNLINFNYSTRVKRHQSLLLSRFN